MSDLFEKSIRTLELPAVLERLASKAIREKSRAAAVDCLTLHPLVNSYSLATRLVDSYIALNKEYSDGWK